MIGCFLLLFRPLFTIIFSVILVVAFVTFLITNAVTNNVLTAEFYTEPLAKNQVYDRFYDEVLVDPGFEDTKNQLLGDIEVPSEDVATVARAIMPPSYLQEQVEGTINATVNYINKDSDSLELYIDLAAPIDNAKAQLMSYVDTRIDTLEVVPAPTREDLEQQAEAIFREVQAGRIPTQVPSLESIPVEDRLSAYDQVVEALKADPSVPESVTLALDDPETSQAIRQTLMDEDFLDTQDLRATLKQAKESLATPLVDDALDQLRRRLTLSGVADIPCQDLPQGTSLAQCTRYDLLKLAADSNDQTKAQLLGDLDSARDGIDLFNRYGKWLAILVMVIFTGLIALIHLPRISSSLRAPGIVLGLTGLAFLIVGLVLNSTLPDRLDSLVEEGIERTDLPRSIFVIATNVTGDMASDISSGFIPPSIVLLVIGGLLVVASFVIRRIPVLRHFL